MKTNAAICSGVLCVHKTAGMTSHDVVAIVRRLFHTREVGHTGTLDPMATGVLPVLVGRAVKASSLLVSDRKRYTVGLQLGITTDTEDTTGKTLTQSDTLPTEDTVRTEIATFLGDGTQVPPMYSALKVDGQKLVDLARRGITIEREARPIHIFKIDVLQADADHGTYLLDVICSKGTYMRTLCADIGATLGCGGAMCSLVRTESGAFTMDACVTLAALEEMDDAARAACVHPLSAVFADLPRISLSPFFAKLGHAGAYLYQKKLGTAFAEGTRVTLWDDDVFFALGEVQSTAEGSAIHPIKQFVL